MSDTELQQIRKIIGTYQWTIGIFCAVMLLACLILAVMLAVVVPDIIRETISGSLDNRHGALVGQIQSLFEQECTK